MEKAYKLEFAGSRTTALTVSSCGVSRTEPLHSFGPAVKPHNMIHYIMSGKGTFTMNGVTYPLSAGNGFLIVPDELVFYQADEKDPWTYVWVGFTGEDVEAVLEEMGLNKERPIFQSEHADELYRYVEDMMEHNTSGLVNELR
nr:AraC family ligand binding domain-containing protein [Lachnospiraceae bacterium]